MKLYIFTKQGIIRTILLSVALSVYFSIILLNFASRKMSLGNLMASILFIVAVSLFLVLTKKKHPPLHYGIRGWMIADISFCALGVVFSLLEFEFSGFIGSLIGFAVMLFISPFYGFGYIFNNGFTVCLIGALAMSSCLFIPRIYSSISRRRRLSKKYE